jgi:hypothetical protein
MSGQPALQEVAVTATIAAMKTIRHTINVPAEMEQRLNDRIADFRSLSAYFVALCFTDLLYLPKRPIAKAFATGRAAHARHGHAVLHQDGHRQGEHSDPGAAH